MKLSLMDPVQIRFAVNESGEAVGFGKVGAFRTCDGGRVLSHDHSRSQLLD